MTLAFCMPARAADPGLLEPVIVTGSRLGEDGFESASPVAVVPGSAFIEHSAVSVEHVLAALPQFVPATGATSNSPGNDGQANLSLRGIGSAQTLVLLDGRRITPADGRGAVDVNLIPAALIESVEVVTGGTAATYGSDAVAGVVNFRLRPTFDGLQAEVRGSRSDHGDGNEYAAELTGGRDWADGRGSLVFSTGYARRDGLRQTDRSWSAHPLQYYADETDGVGPGGAFLDSGAGITAEGVNVVFSSEEVFDQVFSRYGYAPGSVPYQAGIGVNLDGTLFTTGDQVTPGTVVNYKAAEEQPGYNDRSVTTNLAPQINLQLPLERASLFLRADFDWSDTDSLQAQVLYADYSTTIELGAPDSGIVLASPANPYVPADLADLLVSRVNPDVSFRLLKRLEDLPNRVADHDRQFLQVTVAADGAFRGDWSYEAYLQWGDNKRREHRSGNALTGEIEALVNSPDGGLSACGVFNLFGDLPIDPACAGMTTTDATNRMAIEQFVAEAVVDGPLASLPDGELRAAIGIFHKHDQFSFRADPLAEQQLPAVPGIIGPRPVLAGFPSAPSRRGSEVNTDLFAELRAPLWAGADAAEILSLGLGYRRTDYDRAGAFDAYKADVSFRPAASLRLRGSFQHSIRAPGVDELFYPQLHGQFYVTPPDPCSFNSPQRSGPDRAAVEALCLAQGLPPDMLDDYRNPLARAEGVSGGNPDLVAETSDSITLGFIYTSASGASWGDLRLAVDGYRIELEDAVSRWETDTSIRRCFDPAYNPAYDAANAYCTFFERSAIDGTIFTYEIDRNTGGVETTGVDLELNWQRMLGPGHLAVGALVGFVDSWKQREPNGSTVQLAGTLGGRTIGGAIARWRTMLRFNYGWQRWQAYATLRYLDGMRDASYRDFLVSDALYVDVGLSADFTGAGAEGWTILAGIENLGDVEPPLFPSWQQANTDPSRYDVLGRRLRFGLRYRF